MIAGLLLVIIIADTTITGFCVARLHGITKEIKTLENAIKTNARVIRDISEENSNNA